MAEHTEYKVRVETAFGKVVSFTLQSSRKLVANGRINYMTNPLLGEVMREAHRRANDPGSKVYAYGGVKKLLSIENVMTLTVVLYDLYI